MAARGKKTADVAKVAAAAAAAAVTQQANTELSLIWNADDDDDEEVDQQAASDILEDLEQIDETHGGDITWELYCDTPVDKAGQIGKLARSELRDLRDRCLAYGPGEYHVVARGRKGKFVPKSRRNIKISGFAPRPAGAAAPTQPVIDPVVLFAQYEERAERRRIEARLERQQQIKFWAPILAPIGIEMAKGLFGRSNGESIKDLVGALVGMKGLMSDGGGSTQVDSLLKGIELARELSPESAKGSTWPDVLVNGVTGLAREFRPLVESMANKRGQPGQAPPATQSAAPKLQFAPIPQGAVSAENSGNGPSATPAAGQPNGADEMLPIVQRLLERLAEELEEFAANAADPQLAAEALLAKIPRLIKSQMSYDDVRGWLSRPDWWQYAEGFRATLKPYQAFCDDVRMEILAILEEEQQQQGGSESAAAPDPPA